MDTRTDVQTLIVDGEEDAQISLEVLLLGGRQKVGVLDAIPFEQITSSISSVVIPLYDSLKSVKPKKASVELGFEFAVQEGNLVALIARGSGKANIKVTLEW